MIFKTVQDSVRKKVRQDYLQHFRPNSVIKLSSFLGTHSLMVPRMKAITILLAYNCIKVSFASLRWRPPTEDLLFCDNAHQPELWRVVVAAAVNKVSTVKLMSGHVYEVGVFTGNSMLMLQEALNPPMIWGFDSFAGLPDPSTQEMVSEWHAGKYADDPRLRLKSALGEGRHGWVAGFYNESLAPEADAQVATLGMQPVR